jgi:hypothetical protein
MRNAPACCLLFIGDLNLRYSFDLKPSLRHVLGIGCETSLELLVVIGLG